MARYVIGDDKDHGLCSHLVDEAGISPSGLADLGDSYNPLSTFQTVCGKVLGSDPVGARPAAYPRCSNPACGA
jgi:hypothetical protein